MNFRFTNNLFESEWVRQAIERIDVTLLESIGAEKRGAFYDSVGALRDVGQNHLLQMLALVTMEQPAATSPAAIRDSRAELIESLRPMTPGELPRASFRAQHERFDDIDGRGCRQRHRDRTLGAHGHERAAMGRRAGRDGVGQADGRGVQAHRRHLPAPAPVPLRAVPSLHQPGRVHPRAHRSDRDRLLRQEPGFDTEVEERRFSFFLTRSRRRRSTSRSTRSCCTTRSGAIRRCSFLHAKSTPDGASSIRSSTAGKTTSCRSRATRLTPRQSSRSRMWCSPRRPGRARPASAVWQDGRGPRPQPARSRLAGGRLEPHVRNRRGHGHRWTRASRDGRRAGHAPHAAAGGMADGAGGRSGRRPRRGAGRPWPPAIP